MRVFTLSKVMALIAISATCASAQKFIITSPPTIAQAASFTATNGWGSDLTSGEWSGDLVLVTDGTAAPTEGCQTLTNGAQLAGKIALIDRGTCNFSVKAYNAQNAGAIAAVILNTAAGTILPSLGSGTNANLVTIPVVMLSYRDGQMIKAALTTGAVSVRMGTFKVANDISTNFQNIVNAVNGVVPFNQVDGPGELLVSPGVNITNTGTSNVANVGVTATISHLAPNGAVTEVYKKSEGRENLAVDSSIFYVLEDYDAGVQGEGVYQITYDIAHNTTDGYAPDNTVSSLFYLSKNVYCKSGWDFANNRPVTSGIGRTVAGGGNVEFISGFHVKRGKGMSLDSVTYHIFTAAGTNLDGTKVSVLLYEWNDLNADGGYNNDELLLAGFNSIDYTGGLNSVWTTLPLIDLEDLAPGVAIKDDEKDYLIGVRFEGNILAYISFNDDYDLGPLLSVLDAKGILTTLDFPYYVVNEWDGQSLLPDVDNGGLFTGVRGTVSSALYINPDVSSVDDILTDSDVDLKIYPNPAADILTAEVKLARQSEFLTYEITNVQGKQIFSTKSPNTLTDKAVFKIGHLPQGQYFLRIRTENGMLSKSFSVMR